MRSSRSVLAACLLLASIASSPGGQTSASNPGGSAIQPSFAGWKAACDKLPSNRLLRGRMPTAALLPLPRFGEFEQTVLEFFEQCKTGLLSQTNRWLGKRPADEFFDTSKAWFMRAE